MHLIYSFYFNIMQSFQQKLSSIFKKLFLQDNLQRFIYMDIQNKFLIDGNSLTISSVDTFLKSNQLLDLTDEAWKKVAKSRSIITNMMSDPDRVVYGINTGFGNFADKIISKHQRQQLQHNLITSHAVGVGKPLPLQTTRRMMLLRINTLAKGRSGISVQNLQKCLKAFNSGFIPYIPEKGTVGASGDLAPLSHLALGLLGQGKAWDDQSKQFSDASVVLKKKSLEPMILQQKQGIALINGTQFMTSIVSQTTTKAEKLFNSAIAVLAISLEIFGFDKKNLSEKVISMYEKNNKTMGQIMKKIRGILDEGVSKLHEDRIKKPPHNKNSQSVLFAIQALAGVFDSIKLCKRIIEEEMNSATDNPLVYNKEQCGSKQDMLISAGNFHGQYVAKVSDYLGYALFTIGKYSQARIERYINGRISNLHDFLIQIGGLNNGFMIVQYTSAALLSQCKVLSKPASADSIPTSASQQDHVSMGGYASRKSQQILQNISYIVGIQLMMALQSIDMLQLQPSKKIMKLHEKVRKQIPFIETDYYFGPYLETAKEIVKEGISLQ